MIYFKTEIQAEIERLKAQGDLLAADMMDDLLHCVNMEVDQHAAYLSTHGMLVSGPEACAQKYNRPQDSTNTRIWTQKASTNLSELGPKDMSYINLVEAKEALFSMILQFMYQTTGDDGQEYFDDYCESAGEKAFTVLGFSEDRIKQEDFYRAYDQLEDERRRIQHLYPRSWSYLESYLEARSKKLEKGSKPSEVAE